jgi:hypothetical protein
MRRAFTIAIAVCALAGCKSDCRKLSEKLCDCTTNTTDRTVCMQSASLKETYSPPSDADNATCRALYDGCDCHLISTPRGKVQCGMARPYAGFDAGL